MSNIPDWCHCLIIMSQHHTEDDRFWGYEIDHCAKHKRIGDFEKYLTDCYVYLKRCQKYTKINPDLHHGLMLLLHSIAKFGYAAEE